MRADQSQLAQSAWVAVESFLTGTDPQATTTLYRILHDSAGENGVHVLSLPAPQLLQHALRTPAETSGSRLLVIAILNHVFCTRLLPLTQQRPTDCRAVGLDELEELYLGVLHAVPLPPAVERQLVPCAAMLLVLNHPRALAEARRRFLDTTADNGASTSPPPVGVVWQRQRYLSLFMALCDLLTDRRVPLGPVQRARQLHDTQQSLDMLLAVTLSHPEATQRPPASQDERALIQCFVQAVGRGATLLQERAFDEPLDLCPAFWEQLPSHPIWQVCLQNVHEGDPDAVDAVCHVLRCLTVMEPASERLLASALAVALQTSHAKLSYELITAALEASTESVILNYEPSQPLFLQLSQAAERLIAPLRADHNGGGTAPSDDADECALLACEGVAVLAQALTPFPIPEMEATDDPEDYAAIVEEMQAANANKLRVLGVMREFFVAAQRLLFTRLASCIAEDDYTTIAHYLEQCLVDDDDSAVVFDAPCVAYYSTYERLYALLGTLPVEAIHATENGTATLATVGCDGRAALWALQHQPLIAASQAGHSTPCATPGIALLPILVRRFTTAHTCFRGACTVHWGHDDVRALVGPLVTQLQCACSDSNNAVALVAPIRHMVDAVVCLVEDTALCAIDGVAVLPQTVFPIMWQWLCDVSRSASALDEGARRDSCRVAECLGRWILQGLCSPEAFGSFVSQAVSLVPPFQVEVLSALAPTSLADVAGVLDLLPPTLRWLGEAQHEAVFHRVGQRLANHVQGLLAGGNENAGMAVSETLRHYAAQEPVLCSALLTILTGCDTLPQAPDTALECVSRAVWSLGRPADIATTDLEWILQERVCALVASSSPIDSAHSLLQALLQPSPSFATGGGVRRLFLVARLGRMLLEGGRSSRPFLASCYAEALQRLLECVSAHSLGSFTAAQSSTPCPRFGTGRPPPKSNDEDEEESPAMEAMLQEMAALGRCATAASTPADGPANVCGCLARLAQCGDDYERLATLKGFVQ